jgi:acyl-CoA synthetase (AMP-forming)/AMP-acid ligase II
MNLTQLILLRNSGNPDAVCLVHGEDSYTYKDLFSRIEQVKGFLHKKTKKGDRIGIFCENGIEFVSAYLACLDSRVVSVPTNTSFSSEELQFAIKNCKVKMFLCSERMRKRLKVDIPVFLISDILSRRTPPHKPGKTDDREEENELAALIHTSGSTGKPNAVMVTHGNLLANTKSILTYLHIRPNDKTMVVLPFYYCYGASLLHMTLCSGGQVVINNKFMFPQKVVNEMFERRCTIFAGVPSTYQITLKYTKMNEMDMSSLRYALQAGGKLSKDYLQQVSKALPGTSIVVMYGQTEATARLSYLPPRLFDSKLGSIGKGIPGVELRVVDEHGKDVKPGEVGEIIARGKNITRGYLNNSSETKKTFRKGWLYTGDLAKVDGDGFIFIVDRKKDFVKVGGNRVSLTEIEECALRLNGVDEAVAIGVSDEILGEAIALFVVPKNHELLMDQVLQFCRKKLPSYKVPKVVDMIEKIPRNAYGKVQRFKLLERLHGPNQNEPVAVKEAGHDG